jgi:hypothetical protein
MQVIFKSVVLASVIALAACNAKNEAQGGSSTSTGASATVQDSPKARSELAERYFKLMPLSQMMKDMATEMANNMPPEQRQDFVQFMTQEIQIDVLEKAAKESMSKHMTAQELGAFVSFIEKPEGKSAMGKMKFYMADIMPIVQQEVMRAIAKRQGQ